MLVIGYISRMKKYYITTMGSTPLGYEYDLDKNDITITEFVTILQEFFKRLRKR